MSARGPERGKGGKGDAPTGPTARAVAAQVVARVERDKAFAAAALEAELSRAVQLDARDRAFATELAYGSLRVKPWLEARLAKHTPKGIAKLDPIVRAHLVVAAYQVLLLTRTPAFAAVNACVDLVRAAKGERLAAFANAVLRKIAAEPKGDREEALAASIDPWLAEALTRSLGADGAKAFLASALESPPVCLRVSDAAARDEILATLRAAHPSATFEAGPVSPLALLVRGAGKPQALDGYDQGTIAVQEEGSQVVALALGTRPGESALDACAGRGNKTAILARAAGEHGAVDACDLHANKLGRLEAELARVGLRARATYAVDWSIGAGDVGGTYDRVLVDAPCSGVGTLRRRPEIGARRAEDDLAELSRMQIAIATRAADRVKPGGRLVYAVCSVLREESEDVVEAFLAARPDFAAAPFDESAADARAIAGDATSFRLLPQVHGTDGYFVASFVRRGG